MSYNHGLGFGIIPVGGRTNVTSATKCPSKDLVGPDCTGQIDIAEIVRGTRVAKRQEDDW